MAETTQYQRVSWVQFPGVRVIVAGIVQGFMSWGWALYSWTVFVRILMTQFRWSAAMIGGYSSFAYTTAVWAPIVAGFHVDSTRRFAGPAWTSAIWLSCIVVGYVGIAFMTEYWQGFILYSILLQAGMQGGIYRVSYVAANRWFMDRRATAISCITLGGGLGGVVLIPYVAIYCEQIGWRPVALVGALMVLVFAVGIAPLYPKFMPEHYGLYLDNVTPEERRRRAEERAARRGRAVVMRPPLQDITVRQALRSFTFWCLVASGAVMALGAAPLGIFQNARMGALGYSLVDAANFYSLNNTLTYVGRLFVLFFGDWLTARFPVRFNMAVMYMIMVVGFLFFGYGSEAWHFYLWAIFYGIGFGLMVPYYAVLLGAYFGRQAFGAIYGLRIGIPAPFGIAAPTLCGWLADVYGWEWPFLLAAVAYTAGTVILLFAVPPKEQLRERVRE